MRVRVVFLFFLALQFSCTSALPVLGLPSPDALQVKLNSRVHDYSLDAGSFVEALDRVARDFQIPMGIEWIITPSATSKISMSWNDASVLEVIESIAKTQKGYEVSLKNGTVHVRCSSLIPSSLDPGLVKIKSFEMSNVSLGWVSKQLRDQVKLIVSPLKSAQPDGKPHGSASSFISSTNEPIVSINLRNVTAEDILDKMVVDSARYIWILTFSDDQTLTPTGFRRTITLWNDFPIPDDQQPVWDLLHWTDRISDTVLRAKRQQ